MTQKQLHGIEGKTRIDAIVQFSISFPYSSSLYVLQTLCGLWDFSILSSSTNSDKATVAMPWKSFKRMFKKNPFPCNLDVPTKLQKYITGIEVIGVRIVNINAKKDAKKKKSSLDSV